MAQPALPPVNSHDWYTHYQALDKVTRDLTDGITLPDPASQPTTTLLWDGTGGGTANEYGYQKVNPAQWTYAIGDGPLGPQGNRWGNFESETYTDRLKNVYVKDGLLQILAIRDEDYTEPTTGRQADFTSGRIDTQGKVSVPVGAYVEARIKFPACPGVWCGFWMQGDNYAASGTTSTWPNSGEADIVETLGQQRNYAGTAIHMRDLAGGTNVNKSIGWETPGLVTDMSSPINKWHYYGCYHDANTISFYVDRVLKFTYTASQAAASGRGWPFNQGMFLLLNVAVGGLPVGVDGGDSLAGQMPNIMTVAPIKIWNSGVPF